MTALLQPDLRARELRRWRIAVGTAFALGGVLLSTWGPRLPAIKAELGLGDGALGLLVLGSTVSAIIGLLCSSALHARLGSRRGIALTGVLASAGVAVIGLGTGALRSPAIVEIGFLGVGFGIGVLDVIMNVEGAAIERAGARVIMPLLHACWSAGAVLGSAIGALAAATDAAPQWQFLGEALLCAVAALLASRWIPLHPAPVRDGAPVRDRLRGWLRGWRDLRLLVIGLVMLGVELGEGSANTWLTLGVAQGHHQRADVAALYFTAFAVSETVFRAVSSPLVQRFGRVAMVRVTTACGVLGLVAFVLSASPWIVLAGTVLWAVGVSLGFPLGMSAAAEGDAPGSAARVSVVASIGYLAGLAGPPVVGYLSDAIGLPDAFWLLVAALAVALVAAGALGDPRPRSPRRQEEALR